jgi:hypothetical protein
MGFSENFEKNLPKEKNRPMYKNLPNLVTLVPALWYSHIFSTMGNNQLTSQEILREAPIRLNCNTIF